MSSDESSLTSPAAPIGCPRSVLLSRWVNERFPDWGELLNDLDVAREQLELLRDPVDELHPIAGGLTGGRVTAIGVRSGGHARFPDPPRLT